MYAKINISISLEFCLIDSIISNIFAVSSIFEMLENSVGSAIFQNGLQNFIHEYSMSTVSVSELLDSVQIELERTSTKFPASVDQLYSPWFLQAPDIPTVQINRVASSNGTKITIDMIDSADKFIPISITTEKNQNFDSETNKSWLKPGNEVFLNSSDKDWIMLNKKATNIYRVNYDEGNWKLLTEALKRNGTTEINALARAHLISDSFNLARNGELKFQHFFDILTSMEHETDFIPWTTTKYVIDHMERILRGHKVHDKFMHLVQQITTGRYNEYSILAEQTDDHFHRLNRQNVATMACMSGVDDCVDEVDSIIHSIVCSLFIVFTPKMSISI